MPIENGMQRIYKSPGKNFGRIISELVPIPKLESAAEIMNRINRPEKIIEIGTRISISSKSHDFYSSEELAPTGTGDK